MKYKRIYIIIFTTNGPAIKTINLEAGLPTVEEALRRLAAQLDRARLEGVRVVRLIHGWGSAAGGGGRIRAAVRQWLQQEAEARRIHFFLPGDHFNFHTCLIFVNRQFYPAMEDL